MMMMTKTQRIMTCHYHRTVLNQCKFTRNCSKTHNNSGKEVEYSPNANMETRPGVMEYWADIYYICGFLSDIK